MRLIEVCAGSAAVTLAAVGGKLPLYYRGGKRRHARQILTVLQELAASRGAGGFTSFTLNEPGMFGTFWAVVRQTPFRKALVAELRALHKEVQGRTAREFWQALVAAPVPCGIVQRVAVWVALQRHSYGARPVELALEESVTGAWKPDQRWRASGFLGAAADRGAQREAALAAGNQGALRWAKSSPTLADLADAIDALPRALLRPQDGGALHVLRADARRLHLLLADVPSVVFIDPPYVGTSCGYAAEFSRADVLVCAQIFVARGYPVAVSEAEPLAAIGSGTCEHRQLAGPTGGGRTASRQQAEWLTIYRPARSRP